MLYFQTLPSLLYLLISSNYLICLDLKTMNLITTVYQKPKEWLLEKYKAESSKINLCQDYAKCTPELKQRKYTNVSMSLIIEDSMFTIDCLNYLQTPVVIRCIPRNQGHQTYWMGKPLDFFLIYVPPLHSDKCSTFRIFPAGKIEDINTYIEQDAFHIRTFRTNYLGRKRVIMKNVFNHHADPKRNNSGLCGSLISGTEFVLASDDIVTALVETTESILYLNKLEYIILTGVIQCNVNEHIRKYFVLQNPDPERWAEVFATRHIQEGDKVYVLEEHLIYKIFQ